MRLESLTTPVGLTPVLPALQKRVELCSGDWPVIFSDGIPEATNRKEEEFGDDGLFGALGCLTNGTAAELCEGIVNEVRDHLRERRQPDDITLIAGKAF
jgi:serine phosphatase RsbU (regulator of sigma subunit)